MSGILSVFMVIIQIVAFLTAASAVFLIIVRQIDTSEEPGSDEALFFGRQLNFCRWATLLMLIVGWVFCNPFAMGGFDRVCLASGVFWFFVGVAFLLVLIYCAFTRSNKSTRNIFRGFAVNTVAFGVFLTVLSWLLWG